MSPRPAAVLLAALLVAGAARAQGDGPRRALLDRVAAVVDDEVIALSEVYDVGGDVIERAAAQGGLEARRRAELEVLDSLVERVLVDHEVRRLGIDVEDADVDRAIEDIARRNGIDRDNLRTEIEVSGLSWDEYRAEIREQLRRARFVQSVIRPRISVDEDELRDAYRRLLREADLPREADLGAIFIPFGDDPDAARARAAEALARIRAGEDFAAVARATDEGPYGAADGRMGTYRQGELIGPLDRAAFSLRPGETSEPVETAQGVFLVHVFDVRTLDPPAFEDVRDQLFEQVYAARIEDETRQWVTQARRRAAVIVKLEE